MFASLSTSACTALTLVVGGSAIASSILRANKAEAAYVSVTTASKPNVTATTWHAPATVTFGHIHGHRRPPS